MIHVAMTAFNRPHYLKETLESWDAVRGEYEIHLAIDPGTPTYEQQNAILAQEHGLSWEMNPKRYGVLDNVWHNLDRAFEDHDFVAVAEDDVLVSDDIIEFYAWARDEYRDNENVLAVIATQLWIEIPEGKHRRSARMVKHFSATAWATWKDRWTGVLRDGWDHDYSKNGWDWWVGGDLIVNGPWWVVCPSRSRASHIGVRGAHMTPRAFPYSQPRTFEDHYVRGKWREV